MFDTLLEILNLEDNSEETNAIIWDILIKLPTNKTLYEQIFKAEQPWENVFIHLLIIK